MKSRIFSILTVLLVASTNALADGQPGPLIIRCKSDIFATMRTLPSGQGVPQSERNTKITPEGIQADITFQDGSIWRIKFQIPTNPTEQCGFTYLEQIQLPRPF